MKNKREKMIVIGASISFLGLAGLSSNLVSYSIKLNEYKEARNQADYLKMVNERDYLRMVNDPEFLKKRTKEMQRYDIEELDLDIERVETARDNLKKLVDGPITAFSTILILAGAYVLSKTPDRKSEEEENEI